MRLKPGVSLRGLQPQTVVGMLGVESLFAALNYELVITSCNDSTHGVGSLHGKGFAFDLRTKHILSTEAGVRKTQLEKLRKEIAFALGEEFDVVLEYPGGEQEHIHVEYDDD